MAGPPWLGCLGGLLCLLARASGTRNLDIHRRKPDNRPTPARDTHVYSSIALPRPSVHHEDCQYTSRPLAAMASHHADGERIPPHQHPRAQLVHAISGVMTIGCPHGRWVVPTGRAVWVPPDTSHDIQIAGQVGMRTVFVAPDARSDLPSACEVIEVSSLLREAIIAAVNIPLDYALGGRDERVMQLILDEVQSAPRLSTQLPVPSHPRLATLCARLIAEPALSMSLEEAAEMLCMSSRTLSRLFYREIGMSFPDWRRHTRLLLSLSRLASGMSIFEVALEHGYDSPSAFTAVFKRVMGVAPSAYLSQLEPS
jgi:AraC-like DNA-binding protein